MSARSMQHVDPISPMMAAKSGTAITMMAEIHTRHARIRDPFQNA
jgi:hypothetical protein